MDPNYKSPSALPQPDHPFQPPAPAPRVNDPYSFIMDTEHQPKKKLIPSGNSTKSRLLMVVGIGLVLITAIIVISSLLSGGSKQNSKLLTDLAAEQTEIIRLTDLGLKGSTNPDTLAYAQTAKLSVTADQNKLIGYLATKKVKVTSLILKTKFNKNTDALLASASANNQFDAVFVATLKQNLKTYSADVKTGYDNASNPTSKAILKDSFTSTSLLLK